MKATNEPNTPWIVFIYFPFNIGPTAVFSKKLPHSEETSFAPFALLVHVLHSYFRREVKQLCLLYYASYICWQHLFLALNYSQEYQDWYVITYSAWPNNTYNTSIFLFHLQTRSRKQIVLQTLSIITFLTCFSLGFLQRNKESDQWLVCFLGCFSFKPLRESLIWCMLYVNSERSYVCLLT